MDKICNKVREVFSEEKRVIAIFNNGSSVVKMNQEGSDEDFVIILKNEREKDKILRILRKNFRVIKNKEDPKIEVEEQFDIFDKRADFTIISEKEVEKKINCFYKSQKNFLELQHFVKHKIIDAVAIYDPNKILIKWRNYVRRYPKKFMKNLFDSQINLIKENLFYWKHHKFRNEFQFGFEQWEIIQPICQALYAKNNKMFMLPYKRLHKDLKKLKPNIEKEMYKLIRGKNTSREINNKIRIVEAILKKLENYKTW